METIRLNLDHSKKYIVACSFGPDSMALLTAALLEKLNIVVAHVNYRKREESVFEQKSLEDFCDKNHLKLYVLDLLKKKPEGNFQDWARRVRYEFFKNVAEKEHANAVLVAHQQDDVIETYLMQKKRGNFVKNYGISLENEVFGVKIIRPLLGYSKKFLEKYDKTNNVPFSIDKSNLTDNYTRNKIRHSIVEKMTEEEREQVLKEIKNKPNTDINSEPVMSFKQFVSLNYEEVISCIDRFMKKSGKHRDLSEKFVSEIKKAFKSKSTHRIEISESLWLEKDYDDVYFVNPKRIKPYKKSFTSSFQNEFIQVDFSGGAEDRGIDSSIKEFTIKNVDKNDEYIIKDYSSKANRLFIDWKIPLFLREIWPGIYDRNGKLIYVPRYRKDFKDKHKSKFVIDTKYFSKF